MVASHVGRGPNEREQQCFFRFLWRELERDAEAGRGFVTEEGVHLAGGRFEDAGAGSKGPLFARAGEGREAPLSCSGRKIHVVMLHAAPWEKRTEDLENRK